MKETSENHLQRFDFSRLIGDSEALRTVCIQIAQVTDNATTVLITGETGTGKELIAHALHINSPRAKNAYLRINCGALPENLIESELFGHERGAFTDASELRRGRFELANGGTLFLDEVGELSLTMQARLLRVLQEREFERVGGTETLRTDVRLLAATNRDLEAEVRNGRFRADLYYRLNVFTIHVPPLRERAEDILMLAEHFLKKYAREQQRDVRHFSPRTRDLLTAYIWPGNVRELENTIERAVVMAEDQIIHHYHLPPALQTAPQRESQPTSLFESVESFEKDLICNALRLTRGNRSQAARHLRVSERVLSYKVRKYSINCDHFR
jgi:Nif-specific regulatory protein